HLLALHEYVRAGRHDDSVQHEALHGAAQAVEPAVTRDAAARRVQRRLAVRIREPVEHRYAVKLRGRDRDERAEILVFDLNGRIAMLLEEPEHLEVVERVREMALEAREARVARVRRSDVRDAALERLLPAAARRFGGLKQPVDAMAARGEPFGEDGFGGGAKRRIEIRRHEQDVEFLLAAMNRIIHVPGSTWRPRERAG